MMKRSWPPTKAHVDSLERKVARLESLECRERLRPFVDEFLEALGTILASTPFERWPPMAKAAFEHTLEQGYMTTAKEYKEGLPPV